MKNFSYPQFARGGLIFAVAAFLVTALIMELSKSVAIPSALLVAVQCACLFVLLPLLATAGYLANVAETETKGFPFIEDKGLRSLLDPLLSESDRDITFGYCESEIANAYAFDPLFGGKKVLAITTALRDRSSPEQLLAIGAHELAHFRHGDARNKWYLLAFHHMVKTCRS